VLAHFNLSGAQESGSGGAVEANVVPDASPAAGYAIACVRSPSAAELQAIAPIDACGSAARRLAVVEWQFDSSQRAGNGEHDTYTARPFAMPVDCGAHFGAPDAALLAGLGYGWAELPTQVRPHCFCHR